VSFSAFLARLIDLYFIGFVGRKCWTELRNNAFDLHVSRTVL